MVSPLEVSVLGWAGGSVVAAGTVFAQAAAGQADTLTTIVAGGALTSTVGALVYVVRAIVSGQLVPKAVHEREERLSDALARSADALDRAAELHAEAAQREDRLWALLSEGGRRE